LALGQTVGIDRSRIYASRAGIRNNNDLIWVGRAPNIAAKLSSFRNGFHTLITSDVYNVMLDEAKYGGMPSVNMWTPLDLEISKTYGIGGVYGSRWWWEP